MFLFVFFVASGQMTQKGVIKEYLTRGKPIAGVGISIPSASDYQPVVSNADGTFQLHFSRHLPGDIIYNVRITKDDYEIVNIYDFKDGWTLSSQDTMTIIVARRGVITERRSRYYNIMDKYTEEAYKRKIQKLEGDLANQTINAEEYRQKMLTAEEELKRAYEKIDAYADLFARISDEVLDSTSSLAFRCLEEGRIDQAIQLFEDLNLVNQLNKKVALRNESENAIQHIIPKLREEIAYRNLAGGEDNILKIESILSSILSSDPEKFQYQKDYFQFLVEQNKLEKANAFGEKALATAQTPLEKATIWHDLAVIQYKQNQYSIAEDNLRQAQVEADKLKDMDSVTYMQIQSDILSTLANVYIDAQQYGKAQECLSECNTIREKLIKIDDDALLRYATNLSNISELYRSVSVLDHDSTNVQKALTYNWKAISVLESLSDSINPEITFHLNVKYNNRGSIFLETKHLDSALYYLKKADTLWNILYSKNPNKHALDGCRTLGNMALAYSRLGQFDQAHTTYRKAFELYQSSISKHSLRPILVSLLTSEGVLLRKEKRYAEAKQNNLVALDLQKDLAKEEGKKFTQSMVFIYNNLASVSFFAKQIDSAVIFYKLEREQIEGLLGDNPKNWSYSLAECTYYIAYCYYHLHDARHGIPEYKKARKLFTQFNKEQAGKYDAVLADIDKEMHELKFHHKQSE